MILEGNDTGPGTFAWPRMAVFAAVVIAGVGAYRAWPGSPLWLPVALAGIALAIWHGAYDTVLAERVLLPRFGQGWKAPFYASYLALAGLVLMVWWLAPLVALVAFLLYSALHFGTEAEQDLSAVKLLSATAMGFVPIAAACHWWNAAAVSIFEVLLRSQSGAAEHITSFSGNLLMFVVMAAMAGALHERQAFASRAALLTIELVLFRFCPPVIAFAVFFCVWHTPEHLAETSRGRLGRCDPRTLASNLQQGLAPWLLSLGAVGVAAWMGRHAAQSYTGVIFIALSALTVPHMSLAFFSRRGLPTPYPVQNFSRKGLAHR